MLDDYEFDLESQKRLEMNHGIENEFDGIEHIKHNDINDFFLYVCKFESNSISNHWKKRHLI